MKNHPLISIVTPSYNQAKFISEALRSVAMQNYREYEHLVIDGLSTDGTIEILRKFPGLLENKKMTWLCEADAGQSDALNKGFRQAKGEIIGWLNSDDRYSSGCFASVVEAFALNPEVDIIYGDYRIVDESGTVLQIRREIEFSKFILFYHRVLYIPTTATFFRRRVFDEGNWISQDLQYAMDLEFFMRLAIKGYKFKHLSKIMADFRLQPSSKTCGSPDKQKLEHQNVTYSWAPIIRCIKYSHVRLLVLSFFRMVAAVKRSVEKLFRGYYWEQFHPPSSL